LWPWEYWASSGWERKGSSMDQYAGKHRCEESDEDRAKRTLTRVKREAGDLVNQEAESLRIWGWCGA